MIDPFDSPYIKPLSEATRLEILHALQGYEMPDDEWESMITGRRFDNGLS